MAVDTAVYRTVDQDVPMISSVAQVPFPEAQLPSSTTKWNNHALNQAALPPPLPARSETLESAPAEVWRAENFRQFDSQLLCELVNSWDPDFINLLRDGLQQGDTATLQVWSTLGFHAFNISPDRLLDLLTEAMQVRESLVAVNLAMNILEKFQFRNNVELVSASVKTLLSRDPLELLPYAEALLDRGVQYRTSLFDTPGWIPPKKQKHLNASHPPEIEDLAGAACIYMLAELPSNPTQQAKPRANEAIRKHVETLKRFSHVFAKKFAQEFPNSHNPWIAVVATFAPEQLVRWQQQYQRDKSRLILTEDILQGTVEGLKTTGVFSCIFWMMGMLRGKFGMPFSLSAGGYAAVTSILSQRKERRKRAEAGFSPIHRRQVEEKVNQLAVQGKLELQ